MVTSTDIFKLDQKAMMLDLVGENRVGKRYKFVSPLRADNNPGCFLKQLGDKLYMVDFANTEHTHWDVIAIAQKKYCLSFTETIYFLYNKYRSKTVSNTVILDTVNRKKIEREYVKIDITIRPWIIKDQAYWNQYKLDVDYIQEFNKKRGIQFFPISEAFIGTCIYTFSLPTYAWVFKSGKIKIYSPQSTTLKWRSNTSKEDLFFEDDFLHNDLIIVSSYKDALALSPSINCSFRAFTSESSITNIPKIESFTKKLVSFDNDTAGKKLQIKASKFLNVDQFIYNGSNKDWADARKNNFQEYEENIEKLKEYFR